MVEGGRQRATGKIALLFWKVREHTDPGGLISMHSSGELPPPRPAWLSRSTWNATPDSSVVHPLSLPPRVLTSTGVMSSNPGSTSARACE
jgi:hypothetical protein